MENPRHIAGVNVDLYTDAPLRMTKTVALPGEPEAVFSTLTNYKAMPEWFPGMSAVTVNNLDAGAEGGEGAVRVCTFGPDQEITEDIVIFDAPNTLAYAVRNGNFMGMTGHFALLTVEPKKGGSLLSWHQYFNHPDPAAFNARGGAMLDGALRNLLKQYVPA